MILLLAALPVAALLVWFGFVESHWIAPVALFTVSAPVLAVIHWNDGPAQVATLLAVNLALFYAAFALGRSMADRRPHQG